MRSNNRRTYSPIGGTPSKEAKRHAPFPGVIDGHRWHIEEGRWPAFIDRSDLEGEGGVMIVPLEGTDVGRKLRLHEQGHVAWTPNVDVSHLDVSAETIGACEDARIIKMMNERQNSWKRVNTETDVLPPTVLMRHQGDFERLARKLLGQMSEEEARMQRVIPLIQAGRLLAMSRGYFEAEHFDRMAFEVGLGWARDAVNKMHKRFIGERKSPTFDDAIAYARELERFFNEAEEALGEQQKDFEEAELPNPHMPELYEEGRWGDMKTEEAPLTQKLRGDPSRRVRATDMGAVPRYMHRLPTDQRIFGRRRKHQHLQGTVLIDHSGSMSLSVDEVDEILHRWPAVTIATYSGYETTGVMRIVARNGKRASNTWLEPPASENNMIDGPALDWLATQKTPRIWISDGVVTGMGGHTPNLVADAAKKVRRGKIKRIENVQELLERSRT